VKIIRSAKHHVSMGNFEWVEFSESVEIDSDDFPNAKSLKDLHKIAVDYIHDSLANDIEESRLNTAEDESYIHLYKQENN
jgi:hypothetical protein